MINELPKGAHVAVYLRCSTDEQHYSVADQREMMNDLIKDLALNVVRTYTDQGESGGTIEGRPEMIELLNDADKGRFDYLLGYDISRFTRGGNTDFWGLMRELKKRRVLVYSCKHRCVVTEDEAARFSTEASQARAHNFDMAHDVTRAMVFNVTKRNCDPGRRAPFGYDRLYLTENGELYQQVRMMPDGVKQVLDPKTKETRTSIPAGERTNKIRTHQVLLTPSDPARVRLVKRVFEMAKTMSPTSIVDVLNREETVGPTGKRWTASSIREILRNPAYVGTRIFNRRQESRYFKIVKERLVAIGYLDEGKVNVKDNAREDWIIAENAHEALIPRELFDEVQAAMELRHRSSLGTPRSKKKDYLLSGMLVCRRCGSPLTGHTKTSSKAKGRKVYLMYTCSGAKKHGRSVCANYSFPAERVERFVLSTVRKVLSSEAARATLREGLDAQLAHAARSVETATKIEHQLAGLAKKKDRLFQKLDPDKLSFFQPQIEAMQEEERQLQEQLAAARSQAKGLSAREVIARALKEYEQFLVSFEGPCRASIRELLRELGVRLVYDLEKKEGKLTFDSFGQSASKKAQPPAAA